MNTLEEIIKVISEILLNRNINISIETPEETLRDLILLRDLKNDTK